MKSSAYENYKRLLVSAAESNYWTDGLLWYPRVAGELASNYSYLNAETRAYAFAALSPHLSFARNVSDFDLLVRGYPCKFALPACAMKAKEILITDDCSLVSVKTSPKVYNFAESLLLRDGFVCIDIWMTRAAGSSRSSLTKNQYNTLAGAVRKLAGEAKLPTWAVQSVIWTYLRGSAV